MVNGGLRPEACETPPTIKAPTAISKTKSTTMCFVSLSMTGKWAELLIIFLKKSYILKHMGIHESAVQ
jgi:RNA polymerase subunit RPABC4/transcription elongation factor Spt4